MPASQVRFAEGAHGKPHVVARDSSATIEFNVAHSHGRIVIAFARDTPLGVDMERIDANIEALEIAQANFTPKECALLAGLSDRNARAQAFYRIWTRKEAVLKAHGGGLTIALTALDVSGPASPSPLRVTLATERSDYSVQDISSPNAAPDFCAALANSGPALKRRH